MNILRIGKGLAAAAVTGGSLWIAGTTITGEQASGAGAFVPSMASRAERCAVEATPTDQLAFIEGLTGRVADAGGVVTIPVYWHVITTSNGAGDVVTRIADQMTVLRDAFGGSGLAFEVREIEVVANDSWFLAAAGSADEIAMKSALRKGGPDSLNIYTTNGDVYLGWATPPIHYKFGPRYDGVVLWWAAMPGTGLAGASEQEPDGVLTYDQGDTGTHEVGHWLGLEHTFGTGDGSCARPGDFIKDTPTEARPQFFCAPRDSCVGSSNRGDDPITNFMDYVDDVCMDRFTADQTKRMRKHWFAFRDKKTRQ